MRILLVASLFATSTPLLAATPVGPGLLQWLLSCGLVIGFILFLGWLLRKSRLIQPMTQGPMRVLSSLPLGTRERLLVVKVGEQQILLGTTPGRISFLCQLDKPIDEQQLPQPFAAQLGKLLSRPSSQEEKHEV